MSKQLLPVYDKPMIFYPLSVLMLAGIRDVLIITTPEDQYAFRNLLGSGERFGIKLQYAEQPRPEGLAQAFIIGKEFIANDDVCLILGDNIFYGQGLTSKLIDAKTKIKKTGGGIVFAYQVSDPENFGVVSFDEHMNVRTIEEKPEFPQSNYAVTGLYFYDNEVVKTAQQVKPSHRGELEITSVNNAYLDRGNLSVEILGRGYAWLDTGTHGALLEASQFVETIEKRQGYKVACLEEIALNQDWISNVDLQKSGQAAANSSYGKYLLELANNKI